jgi:hypothetical protein
MAEADRGTPVPGTESDGDGIARSEADLRRYATVEELLRDKLSEAIGGWRGAIESALPVVAFTIAWARTQDLRTALLVAGAGVVLLLLVRLVQRQDPRFIAYAAVGVGISAFFALRSGRAEDAFLPGMLQNAGLLVLFLVTNLARWPLFGFVVGVAEQVSALGVAKVVLGFPAYLLAVTAMGAILLRGHTPIDPNRAPA